MSPIRIEDLPPDRELTPEELEKIQGAGRRSPNLEIEGLENREMFAAHLGAALPMGPQAPAQAELAGAHVRTVTPQHEVQVLGMPAPKSAMVTGQAINPMLAPSKDAGRAAFEASYQTWWNRYVCGGGEWNGINTYRVQRLDNGYDTVSEGIAYGMLLTVQWQASDAQDRFTRLWGYAQKNFNEHGLMAWRIDKAGQPVDKGAATDADQDMAMALIMAFKRWGNPSYKADAIKLINNIMQYEVQPGANALLPGDQWYADGPTHINVSYFSPAYYRLFKEFTGDARWDAVREECYNLLKIALSKSGNTGLVPDWMDQQGNKAPATSWQSEWSYISSYDAMRTPWRFALDAAWYGDQRAVDYLNTINAFYKKVGVNNIQSSYKLDGQVAPNSYHNRLSVAMAANAAIVDHSPEYRQQMWSTMNDQPDGFYYNDSLRLMSILFTSDLVEKPVF